MGLSNGLFSPILVGVHRMVGRRQLCSQDLRQPPNVGGEGADGPRSPCQQRYLRPQPRKASSPRMHREMVQLPIVFVGCWACRKLCDRRQVVGGDEYIQPSRRPSHASKLQRIHADRNRVSLLYRPARLVRSANVHCGEDAGAPTVCPEQILSLDGCHDLGLRLEHQPCNCAPCHEAIFAACGWIDHPARSNHIPLRTCLGPSKVKFVVVVVVVVLCPAYRLW
mmetsp:Transcript_92777/g.278338  ORF Transcript_92777/g.278338 Transcript_92777/m.278338 type:complete len:223 (-) Transcript_92777:512-1180(-)